MANEKADIHIYRVKNGPLKGQKITLKPVQPMILNKVFRSVPMPERPYYETKTVTGRVERHPILDELTAEQVEGGVEKLKHYTEMTEAALAEQNERVMVAMFTLGTECEIIEDGWDQIQTMMGIEVPTQKDTRRAHWLMTQLDATEMGDLAVEIMKLTGGVPEEYIQMAEDSFRGAVRDGSEVSGQMVVSNSDS